MCECVNVWMCLVMWCVVLSDVVMDVCWVLWWGFDVCVWWGCGVWGMGCVVCVCVCEWLRIILCVVCVCVMEDCVCVRVLLRCVMMLDKFWGWVRVRWWCVVMLMMMSEGGWWVCEWWLMDELCFWYYVVYVIFGCFC